MNQEPDITPEAARRAFHEHLRRQADATRHRYGSPIDADAMVRILGDPAVVRYPTTLHFDAAPLQPHEFATACPVGFHPSDGFALFVHPTFEDHPDQLAAVIAYHIPGINYPNIIDHEGAELFGAVLLDLGIDAYYTMLCGLADSIGATPVTVHSTES